MYQFPATILAIHDGDTVRVACTPFPPGIACSATFTLAIRLWGIDTPELPTPAGLAARDALRAKLASLPGASPDGAGAAVLVDLHGVEKYGRVLGTLWVDGVNVNDWLVAEGLAKPYGGHGPRPAWEAQGVGPVGASRMLARCGMPSADAAGDDPS